MHHRKTVLVALTSVALASLVIDGFARAPVQSADSRPLSFEVVSIKANKSGDFPAPIATSPGGRFTATNVPARALILYAYQMLGFQLDGGPSWLGADRFDITAKAQDEASPEQIRLMLRTLLADRFKLKVRRETRELALYDLVVSRRDGKLGPQLRRAEPDCSSVAPVIGAPPDPSRPPTCGYLGPAPGVSLAAGRSNMSFRGLTMEAFARFLVPMFRRGVTDRTGLTGYFDGDFDFTSEFGPPPPPPGVGDPIDRPTLPSIFTVLPEQLGLKLEPTKGPVEVLVIESVEKPVGDVAQPF